MLAVLRGLNVLITSLKSLAVLKKIEIIVGSTKRHFLSVKISGMATSSQQWEYSFTVD